MIVQTSKGLRLLTIEIFGVEWIAQSLAGALWREARTNPSEVIIRFRNI